MKNQFQKLENIRKIMLTKSIFTHVHDKIASIYFMKIFVFENLHLKSIYTKSISKVNS